jgi:hypothetical protein
MESMRKRLTEELRSERQRLTDNHNTMESDLKSKLAHTNLTLNQENERVRGEHQSRLEVTTDRHLVEFEAMRSKM